MLNNDLGIGWDEISNFGFFGSSYKKSLDGNKTYFNVGINDGAFFLNGLLLLQSQNFFAYLNPSISYSKKNVRAFDYNFGNINQSNSFSGVGFKNHWTIIKIGRGNENWSAGEGIELALSDKSMPYDYLLLSSDYGHLRVRYIHGFLERTKNSVNRYITGRGLEYTNKKSFIIGLSEVVIYSGVNRQFDFGYLNPVSSHIEIELNDRLNVVGTNGSNAVWQIHTDIILPKNFRISSNYLIDEFVFDKKLDDEKEHRDAFSFRISYNGISSRSRTIVPFVSFISVNKATFRHYYGYNNFVQNKNPLGWDKGSDGTETRLGFNFYNKANLRINLAAGHFEIGNYSTVNNYFGPVTASGEMENLGRVLANSPFISSEVTYSWKNSLFQLIFDYSNQSGLRACFGFHMTS